jgi:hypothetical protein
VDDDRVEASVHQRRAHGLGDQGLVGRHRDPHQAGTKVRKPPRVRCHEGSFRFGRSELMS